MNPGETDIADELRDDRIRAVFNVRKTADGVVRIAAGTTLLGGLDRVRGWGRQAFADVLPSDEAGLAAALLLGDTSALAREEWDKYVRTGVVHALAISGQHLVVLAAFLWALLRLAGVRRKRGAWAVMLLLIAYALLTGARPPAVRAAAQVAVVCGGLILRRPTLPANAFALAWLLVLAIQPTRHRRPRLSAVVSLRCHPDLGHGSLVHPPTISTRSTSSSRRVGRRGSAACGGSAGSFS